MGILLKSEWDTAKTTLNNLITTANAVNQFGQSGVITPAITLIATQSTLSRSITVGDEAVADQMVDSDGMITKYNFMRNYDSCRRYTSSAAWIYGLTVTSYGITGRRDGSFPVNYPAYITPQIQYTEISNQGGVSVLDIVVGGCPYHMSTLFPGAGSEYVIINQCHSACHSDCHGDRNRR
jgi:hypothetical protein